MAASFKTCMHAPNNPLPREQALIGYLLVAMSIAGVYQTAQITDPVIAAGVAQHLAPLLVAIAAAPLLGCVFSHLRFLHLKIIRRPLYTEDEYAALAQVGRHLTIGGWLGKVFLKAKGVSLLMVGVTLLATWLS